MPVAAATAAPEAEGERLTAAQIAQEKKNIFILP